MEREYNFEQFGDYHEIIPSFEALRNNGIKFYHFKQEPGDAVWSSHELIHYVYSPVCYVIVNINFARKVE